MSVLVQEREGEVGREREAGPAGGRDATEVADESGLVAGGSSVATALSSAVSAGAGSVDREPVRVRLGGVLLPVLGEWVEFPAALSAGARAGASPEGAGAGEPLAVSGDALPADGALGGWWLGVVPTPTCSPGTTPTSTASPGMLGGPVGVDVRGRVWVRLVSPLAGLVCVPVPVAALRALQAGSVVRERAPGPVLPVLQAAGRACADLDAARLADLDWRGRLAGEAHELADRHDLCGVFDEFMTDWGLPARQRTYNLQVRYEGTFSLTVTAPDEDHARDSLDDDELHQAVSEHLTDTLEAHIAYVEQT